MSQSTSDRFRRLAATFGERARAVPPERWDDPAPCEGWVARDVVRHMVDWMPAMVLDGAGIARPDGPSVDDDPADAWDHLARMLQSALDDPAVAATSFQMRMGTVTVEHAIATFCLGDVLVHTWDLARATGLDETLDPDEVHRLLGGMEAMDEALRSSGHYGPCVEVSADADELTRLIAFTGRRP